jgi:uncharacterized membrane protein required for colicin V production
MFWTIYGAVLFASFAMMVREGLWSNTISLVNIIVSGLVAFGFYSPMVIWLDEMTDGKYTYWLDFVCIWGLFTVTMMVTRTVTRLASDTRMRFKNPIDPVGGPLVGFIAAWVLATFMAASLHTSPMPADAFGGKLVYSDSDVASAWAVTSPDLAWLRFVERVSTAPAFGSSETKQRFSAKAFVKIYEDHRAKFGNADGLAVQRR